MYNLLVFSNLNKIQIKGRFKFYPYLVCGIDRKIYQLTHFKSKRTCYFKEIKYNEKRNGYRIDSQWVSKNRLLQDNNFIPKLETIEI